MIEKLTRSDVGILVAAAVMALGAFCPILRLPIVGSMSYMMGGRGDGIVVLGCSAAVVGCVAFGYRRTSGLLASGALLTMMTALENLAAAIGEAPHDLAKDKGPFGSLAQLMINSVGLEWGWLLLIGGALAIIILAFMTPLDAATGAIEGALERGQEHNDSFSSADKIIADYLENRKISPAIRNQSNAKQPRFGKRNG
jgi:hypothetical protein